MCMTTHSTPKRIKTFLDRMKIRLLIYHRINFVIFKDYIYKTFRRVLTFNVYTRTAQEQRKNKNQKCVKES